MTSAVLACPECNSNRFYKDGLRYANEGQIQRYLCRNCGYRFSEKSYKVCPTNRNHQLCVIKKAKKLDSQTETKTVAGVSLIDNQGNKGKIIEYLWYMKKQGYAKTTVQTYVSIIKLLHKKNADLKDPESVKEVIFQQSTWGNGRKWNVVKAYTLFLKMQDLTWEKPRYKPIQKAPLIPTEKEIDQLIAGCSKQVATFLQVLKETGARRGEAFNLNWKDIDLATTQLTITPEKGSLPRQFRISTKLAGMIGTLSQRPGRIWQYANIDNLDKSFRRQKKRISFKLQNPKLLKIHFHLLRHWKATTEYAKTKDLLYVQRLLGHRSMKTTLRYTQLIVLPQNEEYICKVATTIEEAKKLIEAGFQYVTDHEDQKLFRKMKTSYLGT